MILKLKLKKLQYKIILKKEKKWVFIHKYLNFLGGDMLVRESQYRELERKYMVINNENSS